MNESEKVEAVLALLRQQEPAAVRDRGEGKASMKAHADRKVQSSKACRG